MWQGSSANCSLKMRLECRWPRDEPVSLFFSITRLNLHVSKNLRGWRGVPPTESVTPCFQLREVRFLFSSSCASVGAILDRLQKVLTDPATADAHVVLVEDDGQPRRDRALRLFERDQCPIVARRLDGCRGRFVAMSDLSRNANRIG